MDHAILEIKWLIDHSHGENKIRKKEHTNSGRRKKKREKGE